MNIYLSINGLFAAEYDHQRCRFTMDRTKCKAFNILWLRFYGRELVLENNGRIKAKLLHRYCIRFIFIYNLGKARQS